MRTDVAIDFTAFHKILCWTAGDMTPVLPGRIIKERGADRCPVSSIPEPGKKTRQLLLPRQLRMTFQAAQN